MYVYPGLQPAGPPAPQGPPLPFHPPPPAKLFRPWRKKFRKGSSLSASHETSEVSVPVFFTWMEIGSSLLPLCC